MKFLQINAVGQAGSTGRNCKEIAQYVNSKTEHSCYTAFSLGVTDEYSVRIGTPFDRKLHSLLSRITGKQAFFSYKSTKKLLRYIDFIEPDVVFLNNLHNNYINLPLLLKYLAKNDIATIIVLHDCWFFTGKCTHYTAEGCFKWQIGCGSCPRLKKDNPSWFFDKTKYLWQTKEEMFNAIPRLGVIGVSKWITDEVQKSYLQTAKQIATIYNWIDLETFSPEQPIPQKLKNEKRKIILGVASFWSKGKGIDSFLTLANLLDNNYIIVLLGRISNDVILPDNIISVGTIYNAEELAGYYCAADVFVTMSLEESFGKVSVEALACGTPIICYNSTANRELVGVNCGEVVPINNIETMVKAIVYICRNGKEFYSTSCRLFAMENFSIEDRICDYIKFAENLLKD